METRDHWYTCSINTTECFAYTGFFTMTVDVEATVRVPRLSGMSRVGNLIRVPRGEVRRIPLPQEFVITVNRQSFTLPVEVVREIRDAGGEILCIRQKQEVADRAPSRFARRIRDGVFLRDGRKCQFGGYYGYE